MRRTAVLAMRLVLPGFRVALINFTNLASAADVVEIAILFRKHANTASTAADSRSDAIVFVFLL